MRAKEGHAFYLGIEAKKAKPTKQHRPALWEMMLGTVIAMNSKGEIRYFDYDYEAAKEFAELGDDLRAYRFQGNVIYDNGNNEDHLRPRKGKLVLWTRK